MIRTVFHLFILILVEKYKNNTVFNFLEILSVGEVGGRLDRFVQVRAESGGWYENKTGK